MGRKQEPKQKYKPRNFESAIGTGDKSANLYQSMLTSEVFTSLKTRQKVLYVYIKLQLYRSVSKPQDDFEDDSRLKGNEIFYFNFGLAQRYGLYSKTGNHEFYSDMKTLCEKGFIECLASGRSTRSRSIYKLSSKWKFQKSCGSIPTVKQAD